MENIRYTLLSSIAVAVIIVAILIVWALNYFFTGLTLTDKMLGGAIALVANILLIRFSYPTIPSVSHVTLIGKVCDEQGYSVGDAEVTMEGNSITCKTKPTGLFILTVLREDDSHTLSYQKITVCHEHYLPSNITIADTQATIRITLYRV